MTQDILLQKLFEPGRWQAAIAKGIDKDIRKDQLYQLTKPEVRAQIYLMMRDGNYHISPPHTALIPKDTPGDYRTVYVNEPIDRIVLSIINDMLFDLCPDMIHPRCKSYQKGIGCGKVVKEISGLMTQAPQGAVIGWKSDLSKYFDSVPLRFIDGIFDKIESRFGKSAVIDILRDYYHSDLFFTTDGVLDSKYQSLKQGCAVAAFLADAILYDMDKTINERFSGYYVRYSDDMLYLGSDYNEAMQYLVDALARMDMTLNPKKVEYLSNDKWFKFLGFSIKGSLISLSGTRIKTFQKEIQKRTVKNRKTTPAKALNSVNRYLYKGDGEHSWASQILPVCNVQEDFDTLNEFVMDCLRAVFTKHGKVGGLGYMPNMKTCCIARGRGQNVTANRQRTDKVIEGYLSIRCMRNALVTDRNVYITLVNSL